ncbi:MAG: hypothetical protein MZV64_26820 [Ignavibacteriales bacterium]|nr:hypothetical protein [Ignavibacteriales bacterium]
MNRDITSDCEGNEYINIKSGDTFGKLLADNKDLKARFEQEYGKGNVWQLLDKHQKATGEDLSKLKAGQKVYMPGTKEFAELEKSEPAATTKQEPETTKAESDKKGVGAAEVALTAGTTAMIAAAFKRGANPDTGKNNRNNAKSNYNNSKATTATPKASGNTPRLALLLLKNS